MSTQTENITMSEQTKRIEVGGAGTGIVGGVGGAGGRFAQGNEGGSVKAQGFEFKVGGGGRATNFGKGGDGGLMFCDNKNTDFDLS
ncbi:hypothetical protein DL96DRAFT_1825768 [Flagelloscypha sp. PMI_526]|nr:hypothetical protein DL96DRAFT_1825768 [Flagelloscypha sp. PMI_526]